MIDIARRVARNFFFLLVSQILAGLFHYAVIIYLARVLEPNEFGMISLGEAILTYFMILSTLGLDILGIRDLGRNKEKVREFHYIDNIITLRLSLTILSFVGLLIFANFAGKQPQMKYLIIYYGLTLFPAALFFDWVFQGIEKMNYSGIAIIIREFSYLFLVAIFIKNSANLLLVPIMYVIARIVSSGFLLLVFKRDYRLFSLQFDFSFWIELIKQAVPFGISFVMVQIIYSSDLLILGFMRSNEEVGYYNAAFKIILFLMIFPYILNMAIFPVMSYYFKASREQLKALMDSSVKIMVTVAFPMALGGTILARSIMQYLYGPKYIYGAVALQILIWSTAIAFINGIYARSLLACECQKAYFKIVILQTAINLITNFLLIPPFGIKGSAFGVFLAEVVGFYFYHKKLNNVVRLSIRRYILKPFMASIIMGLFLFLQNTSNTTLLLQVGGGVVIYGLFIYIFKGVSADTIRILKDAITIKNRGITP